MRTSLSLLGVLSACVTTSPSPLARARALDDDAPRCERFSTFEARLASERDALAATAPGEQLVPAAAALSSAKQRCARATIDGLFERQRAEGAASVSKELEALVDALGADPVRAMLEARWGTDAVSFVAEVARAGYRPGPSPAQTAPVMPDTQAQPKPELPPSREFGEGADRLRRASVVEAARCLGDWSRAGGEAPEVDDALEGLSRRVRQELEALPDDGARAALLGTVLQALSLSQARSPIATLAAALLALAPRVLPQAEQLLQAELPARGALLARPFLVLDATRRRAQAICAVAERVHRHLAQDAGSRALARAVHLSLAEGFVGAPAPLPSLDAGRWDLTRWDCALRPPKFPPLPPGATGRVVASCRRTKRESPPPADPSMKTFEFEASLERVEVRADVTIVCGGRITSQRLEGTELALDTPAQELERPGPLDVSLATLVRDTSARCAASAEAEAEQSCQRLDGDPLDVTQTFATHALRLRRWPPCFVSWFQQRYDVKPPTL